MNKFLKSLGIVTIIALLAKLISFFRDTIMAAYFGASELTDAFIVASLIPNVLFQSFSLAITTGIIPIYSEKKMKNNSSEYLSFINTFLLIMSVIMVIIIYFFVPELIKILAPGFDKDQLTLTKNLSLIILPSFCFYILSAVITGVLQYDKKIIRTTILPIPNSLAFIIIVLAFYKTLGVYALAVGTLAGAIVQFLYQIRHYKVYKIKFNFSFTKQFDDMAKSIKLFTPIIFTSVFTQIILIFDRIIASSLPDGSVSAIAYANKLAFLPYGVVISSILVIYYPKLVDAANQSSELFKKIKIEGTLIIFIIATPIISIMLVNGQKLVEMAFMRGQFNHDDVLITSQVFVAYTVGIIFVSVRDYLSRCFLALKDSRTPFIISVITVLINIVLSFILSKYLMAVGIALASSIAVTLNMVLLFVFLLKKLGTDNDYSKVLLLNIIKVLLLMFVTITSSFWIENKVTIVNNYFNLIIQVALVAIIYILSILIMFKNEVLKIKVKKKEKILEGR